MPWPGAQDDVLLRDQLQALHRRRVHHAVFIHIDHRALGHGHLSRADEGALVVVDVVLGGHGGEVDDLSAHVDGRVQRQGVEQAHGVVERHGAVDLDPLGVTVLLNHLDPHAGGEVVVLDQEAAVTGHNGFLQHIGGVHGAVGHRGAGVDMQVDNAL